MLWYSYNNKNKKKPYESARYGLKGKFVFIVTRTIVILVEIVNKQMFNSPSITKKVQLKV